MSRTALLAVLAGWAGATLVLSTMPGFRTVRLGDRLRPYAPGGLTGPTPAPTWPGARAVLGTVLSTVADRLGRWTGGEVRLAARLRRVGRADDVTAFRTRQLGQAAVALAGGTALSASLRPGPAVGVLLATLPALAAALAPEQRLRTDDGRRRQQLLAELPVVAEQLGMLLSSGYSLGSAIARLGDRGGGLAASDLRRASERIRQGVSEVGALREWAARADLPGLDRLVSVLALNWEAADLGGLISAEARALRREVHRAQVELIERRAQQVWVPVTVATLLPGVIFMAVPFVDAMGRITGA